MDRWEWTKIGGGIFAALTVALGGLWFGNRLVDPVWPARPAYRIPGVAEPSVDLAVLQRRWPQGLSAPGDTIRLRGHMSAIERSKAIAASADAGAAPAAPPPDLGTLLASADPAKGASAARTCGSCHTFDQGGPDRIGPNLWAIVGRDIGGRGGFAYSKAIAAQPGTWTYAELDRYLASPARAIPGNKMAFGGIRRAPDRANLLAYLGSLNAVRAPYPAPKPEAAGAGPAQAGRQ